MSNLFEQFVEVVRKKVPYTVEKIEYYKRNDEHFHGIRLEIGERLGPTISVDAEEITNKNFDEMVARYCRFLMQAAANIPDDLLNYKLCKENIVFLLLNPGYNKNYLENVTTVKFNDLVLVPACKKQLQDKSEATIVCDNNICKEIGIDVERDYDLIVQNTLRCDPVRFGTLEDLLEVDVGGTSEMWIVTSESGYMGAAGAVLAGVRELAMKLGNNVFVLPSSVHELLCLSETSVYGNFTDSMEELKHMVRSVNDDCVSHSDLLSDSVYLYHVDKDEWEVF